MNTIDRLDPVCWMPTSPQDGDRPGFALRDWLARRWRGLFAPSAPHDELAELDAHVLADIGAPEPLLARAHARREVRRQEREGLRIGLAAGAWQHW